MVRLDETSLIQVISARPHRMVCCGPNPPLSPREYADTEGPRNSRKYTCVWNSSSPIKRFLRAHEIRRYGALPVARKIRSERALCKFERDPFLVQHGCLAPSGFLILSSKLRKVRERGREHVSLSMWEKIWC